MAQKSWALALVILIAGCGGESRTTKEVVSVEHLTVRQWNPYVYRKHGRSTAAHFSDEEYTLYEAEDGATFKLKGHHDHVSEDDMFNTYWEEKDDS